MKVAPWMITLNDGTVAQLRPVTVRERIALAEAFAEKEVARAAGDGKASGLKPDEIARHVSDVRRKSRVASALIMDCFTFDGAMRVLECVAPESAERIASRIEPKDLPWLALEALGVDTEAAKAAEDKPGNG